MTNDKQRDRLVELLRRVAYVFTGNPYAVGNPVEYTTEYLLDEGCLFPPLKIGQELWDIHYNKPRKWKVVYLGYNGKEWHFNIHWWKDRHNFKTMSITYPFVGKMWYFTKEEAEQALVNYGSSKNDVERKEDEKR